MPDPARAGRTMAGIVLNLGSRAAPSVRRLCLRYSTGDSTLAVRTSAKSALKGAAGFDAPADVVHQLLGMGSTRFLPAP